MSTRRGRPRSAAVDAALTRAVSRLLIEYGYPALTIEQVATTSGTAKTAIYRRWGSKAEMVFAVAIHDDAIVAPADQGSLPADLHALLQRVITLLSTPVARHALPGLLADLRADPRLTERFHDTFIRAERRVIQTVLERAQARGELTAPPDPAEVHAQLLGTAYAWIFLLPDPPPADLARRITHAVLATLQR